MGARDSKKAVQRNRILKMLRRELREFAGRIRDRKAKGFDTDHFGYAYIAGSISTARQCGVIDWGDDRALNRRLDRIYMAKIARQPKPRPASHHDFRDIANPDVKVDRFTLPPVYLDDAGAARGRI